MIEEAVLQRVLGAALRTGGDFAEVFAEDRRISAAQLDDGRVEDMASGRERGAGIRVVVGETTGFAHTSDLSEPGLRAAAEAAAAAASGGGGGVREVALTDRRPAGGHPADVLPETVAKADKVALLTRADAAARAAGGAIRQVGAVYADSRRRILVANSDGLLAGDDQVKTRLGVSCVAHGDTGMQTGREAIGSTIGFELFDRTSVEDVARTAAAAALAKLSSRPAPSGTMPVVIRAGSGGILFHEACGHGLEADLIAKELSVFAHRVGERVASPLVTLVDDGTMGPQWGTIAIDDEGHGAARNVLIAEGVLTDYMWDWLRARKEGRPSSGNGRRQSYQHLPMVRMTNTFLENGADDPDEIVRQTPHGVYVAQLGGGQVNTATGDFTFGTTEAYLIEDGEITEPLRDTNLIGNGPQALRDIDVVGNDFSMGSPGTCGKNGQGVPVGTGQPTLRVAAMVVGGTAQVTPEASAAAAGGEPLADLAARVAGWASDGEQVEAYVARGRETEVEVFGGEVESLSSAESAGIGIRVVSGSRQGFAYAGSLDADVVAETLAEARDNAGFSSPDEWVGLAVPDGVAAASLDLWRDDLAGYPTADKVAAATALERAVRGADPRIRQVESAGWGDSAFESAVATSTGIAVGSRRTTCYLTVSAAATEGDETQTGYGYSVGRGPSDLDLDAAAGDAAKRATGLLGATKPRSAHLTVVLEPRITASLLAIVAGTLDGDAVAKGRSLFADRLDEAVSSPLVTLVDDPTDPDAFGAAAYDAEGLATRRNVLIDAGVLRRFLYNSYSARRAGTASTGSAVRAGFKSAPGVGARAVTLLPGTDDVAAVYRSVGDGLLVQSVSGLHSGVNPVSGDFSVGAEGVLIRGGELAEPVREITVASTIQRMLQGVVAVGSDLERLPSSASGVTLALADVAMGGA